MQNFKLFLCLVLLLQQLCCTAFATTQTSERSGPEETKHLSIEEQAKGKTLLAILGKSRQSRCVRCFEDRYYEDRSRYPSAGYGRQPVDRTAASNWYYPTNNDESYNSYERYDRYSPRVSERYEGRNSDRGYGGGYAAFDRYDDRRGSYDRGDTRGYERLGYGSQDRDRYYDRSSTRPLDYGLDRDYYDRYNYRYENRNIRPWDETYRGQSGFDNSGRGYYYANNQEDRRTKPEDDRRYLPEDDRRYLPEDDRRYLPEDDRRFMAENDRHYLPEHERKNGPCGRVNNCPYDMPKGSRGDAMSQVSSGAIQSNSASMNAKGSSVVSKDSDKKEQNNDDMRRNENQDRDRQHSSSYEGRAPRPLKRNYLYGREGFTQLNEDDNEIRNNLESNKK